MERFVCVHGHFYQPPRENPWLEAVERQDSAAPYHDWNTRITDECYRSNAHARILDGDGYLRAVINNYARISFNFGPTLLQWLESEAPDVYQAVVEADRESRVRFSGHGSAMAQAYNHLIMPLANRRDRLTQIRWGLEDFRRRFGRPAEGFWLPETAVDDETLLLLDEAGVRFTVLAPHQALGVGRMDGDEETPGAEGGAVDVRHPYRVKVGDRLLNLCVFFYDGPLSQGIAFNGLLSDGARLADALVAATAGASAPSLAHVATDGESYGHHHRYGEMALAFALDAIEQGSEATLTNYGEFLERFVPVLYARVRPNTSWSCVHGIERWRADCGCNSGGRPGWRQAWRAPLRAALDHLRDAMAPLFEAAAGELVLDPWVARDDYIQVILDRSGLSRASFLNRHQRRFLGSAERIRLWKLLELQRHTLLMYTSCGFFFDDVSGIETVQVLQYVGRVLQLGAELFSWEPDSDFWDLLEQAESNLESEGNARRLYERRVRPGMVDLGRAAAHWALALVTMPEAGPASQLYDFRFADEEYAIRAAGRTRLASGRLSVTSYTTEEADAFFFAAVHWGDHNVVGGVAPMRSHDGYAGLVAALNPAFDRADLPEVLSILSRTFRTRTFTLRDLFRDEQERIVGQVLATTLSEVETSLRQIYEYHAPLMRFLREAGTPLPPSLATAAGYVLNQGLLHTLAVAPIDAAHLLQLLEEIRLLGVTVDDTRVNYAMRASLDKLASRWRAAPYSEQALDELLETMRLFTGIPVEVDAGSLAIVCLQLRERMAGPDVAVSVREKARQLADLLRVRWH